MRFRIVAACFVAGLLGFSFAGSVIAAGADSRIEKITPDVIKMPKRPVNAQKPKPDAVKADDWVEIEVEYTLNPAEWDTKDPYVNSVQVKIHVLAPPLRADEKAAGEVYSITLDYGPVEIGKTQYAVAYIPPAMVERMGGGAAFRSRQKCNFAAELLVDGKVASTKEFNQRQGEEGWFTKGGKPGLLLPITKTPWLLDFVSHYPPLLKAE